MKGEEEENKKRKMNDKLIKDELVNKSHVCGDQSSTQPANNF